MARSKEIAVTAPRTSEALSLQDGGHFVPLTQMPTVMRNFNRNTMWVAMGLLGTLIFAAVVLAIQEHHAIPAERPDNIIQKTSGPWPSVNLPALSSVVGLNSKTRDETSPGQMNDISGDATSEMNRANIQANQASLGTSRPNDSPHVTRPKTSKRQRASARLRFVDVKARLLALWHESLAQARGPKASY